MSDLNRVIIEGNATRDPELRSTPSGTSVCSLRIASNRSRKGPDGGYIDETAFVSVTVWGNYGELVAGKVQKGDKLAVDGRLEYREWEQDGVKRNALEVVADNISGEWQYRKGGAAPAAQQTTPPGVAAGQPADDDIPF